METVRKYLTEDIDEQEKYFLNSLVSHIKEYRSTMLKDTGLVNPTVLANEVGNIILSAISKALIQKEADLVKKVIKTGKPLLTYGKGSK
jgi:hypothetical protein